MHRRSVLKALAAGLFARLTSEAHGAAAPANRMGLVIHSYWIRSRQAQPPDFPAVSAPLDFFNVAAALGAGGIQTPLGKLGNPEANLLSEQAVQRGMYVETSVSLPKNENDVDRFRRELETAKSAGAGVARTVCLGGRRYETFNTADEFRTFREQSWKSLTLAEPVARGIGMRLAVENHKDWRVDEMLGWLERLSSEWVGVTLDTGNSMALLEEPHAVVDAYAPWTMTLHFKDMAVREYDDGFLLSEVPLETGCLDMPRIVRTIRAARPEAQFNLEMITRDPLKVPCLTQKYWETMPDVRGADLAETLRRVRMEKSSEDLPTVSGLDERTQLVREEENIAMSFAYARDELGL